MIALIQRVTEASVSVNDELISQIDTGILALIGVEKADTQATADKLLHKILAYRIFSDDAGKMNLSLQDIDGSLLLVPQFTLAAQTSKGLRPSFTPAASPDDGSYLFDYFSNKALSQHQKVAFGRFGADMKVHLVNDGPVTFWLQT